MKFDRADTLHRLVKLLIDNGVAQSIEEAQSIFDRFRLGVEITKEGAGNPADQAAFLTAIVTGRRVFLGGVEATGALGAPLLLPLCLGSTLGDAVLALGGRISASEEPLPTIVAGRGGSGGEDFSIRAVSAGWRGGIVPFASVVGPGGMAAIPLAGMLSGSLAVNEAFLHVNGEMPAAGRRSVGLSLWQPQAEVDWLLSDENEPELRYLPSRAWLIGLGHLGQAYLWGFGLMPYADPKEVHLVLQDIDTITPSTESTSILSDQSNLGMKKTRAMALWAERHGFQCSILERLFDGNFLRQGGEPALAFCGLDNALGRRALDQVGFDLVIEAGLGRGHRDFRTMRLHTLPSSKPAAEIWRARGSMENENVEGRPAYQRLLEQAMVDRCGMTLLAGKAVGAPFVGVTAAALALGEALRQLHGGPVHQLIDLDLRAVEQRLVVRQSLDFSKTNTGYTRAAFPYHRD